MNVSELTILGVPESLSGLPPSALSFPRSFNPQAFNVWKSVVVSNDYLDAVLSLDTDNQKWRLAINLYVDYCQDLTICPYGDRTDRTDNNQASSFLLNARRRLTRAVDATDIFPLLRLRDIKRTITRLPNGFVISSVSNTFGIKDYDTTRLRDTLVSAGLRKRTDSFLELYVASNIQFFVKIINSSRIQVSYSIKILTPVHHPKTERPTKVEFSDFVDSNIWLPIVRGNRFSTYPRITLF